MVGGEMEAFVQRAEEHVFVAAGWDEVGPAGQGWAPSEGRRLDAL